MKLDWYLLGLMHFLIYVPQWFIQLCVLYKTIINLTELTAACDISTCLICYSIKEIDWSAGS